MTNDRYPLPGPLGPPEQAAGSPGPTARFPEQPAEPSRDRGRARRDGVRRVRHMSNWTAAALLVGTGAATVALASHALPATASTATSYSTQGTTAPGVHAPHVGGAVVTSGGSGATVTTTTHVVNGKTVVTQVRHPAVYHDH
jgi:hypothetical protein